MIEPSIEKKPEETCWHGAGAKNDVFFQVAKVTMPGHQLGMLGMSKSLAVYILEHPPPARPAFHK